MKIFYQNRLPHIAPIGASFFITFRLADALPIPIIRTLEETFNIQCKALKKQYPDTYEEHIRQEQKRYFGNFDKQLDQEQYGSCHLRKPAVAEVVAQHLHKYDGQWYDLHAYCIMPNHVHLLIDMSCQLSKTDIFIDDIPDNYQQLHKVMQRIKGASARAANTVLGRNGQFWMKDSYDHYIRNEKEWRNIEAYILNNPVKAGLVKCWEDWPHSYRRL